MKVINNDFSLILIMLLKFILISILLILLSIKKILTQVYDVEQIQKLNNYFDYFTYGKNLITEKMEKQAGWILSSSHVLFLNGIINYHKPKKCLEVGVADGGSSVLILNSLEKIKDSILVSIDLNVNLYYDPEKKTGYRVNKYFPELTKNWRLFTGDQPHKFLDKLNMKFDFVFLDTSHHSPGELINIIEIMPFLNENAIVVLHDINLQLISQNITLNYRPTQIYLMSSLFGDKIYVKNKDNAIENIGAVILYKNQQKHYLDYFLLLTTLWEYMPSESQINDLRLFIKKY